MDPKIWGPVAWETFFLFSRNYPEKINLNDKEHLKIMKSTERFYKSLKDLLPCMYCRESYKMYYAELDIKKYLSGRDKLTEWLYLLKDKVNKKLICQELDKGKVTTKQSPSLKSIIKKYDKKGMTKI